MALDQANSAREELAAQLSRKAAAERIRVEVSSMDPGDDLGKIVAVMFQEMVDLGVQTPACSFQFVDEEAGRIWAYVALVNPRKHGISWTSPDLVEFNEDIALYTEEHSISHYLSQVWSHTEFIERWRTGETWSTTGTAEVAEQQIRGYIERFGLEAQGRLLLTEQGWVVTNAPFEQGWVVTNVPFAHGTVGFREAAHSDASIATVQELTNALSLGYLRFLDFQTLEGQNRELAAANRQIGEANRLKADFLSRMSHDLRTPMNAIIGYSSILLRKTKDLLDQRQYTNLENIQTSANNMLNLIDYILDLSTTAVGHLYVEVEDIDMQVLIGECIAEISPEIKPGVELVERLEAAGAVRTDAERLRRAIMDLLDNAAKFTEEGTITVSLQTVEERIEVSVADTGPGISPENLPRVFDEFHQVERRKTGAQEDTEGTGLSLANAKKSIELLGGIIYAQSEVGAGSTFTIRLADCEAAL